MGQESLAEAIRPKQWYNPFPKIRYTERPDTAAATVLEGHIVVLVDNTPAVMLLPTTIFDYSQEINDFYFPPLVGTYLRILRMTMMILSLFITPMWYLLVNKPNRMPDWLIFLAKPEPCALPLLAQLLVVEFLIDLLKLACLNTPNALSNSFSMELSSTAQTGQADRASDADRENEAKRIYTADLRMETTAFDDAAKGLAALVDELGGWMQSSSVDYGGSGYRYGNYTARIPQEKFDQFISRAGKLCHAAGAGDFRRHRTGEKALRKYTGGVYQRGWQLYLCAG